MGDTETYVGFYTSRLFWAKDAVNPENFTNGQEFTQLMSEEVFSAELPRVTVKICRDGMVMLQCKSIDLEFNVDENFDHILNKWNAYSEYLNVFYFLLDTSVYNCQKHCYFNFAELTCRDVFRVTFADTFSSCGSPQESYAKYCNLGRSLSMHSGGNIMFNRSPVGQLIVQQDTFDETVRLFELIIRSTDDLMDIANCVSALSQYKNGDFSLGIILSWFVIERRLNTIWKDFLDKKWIEYGDGRQRINSDRYANLQGANYTSNTISNFLELEGLLLYNEFDEIDKIRRWRNNIAHSLGKTITRANCLLAINRALKMIMDPHGESLTLNSSLSSAAI